MQKAILVFVLFLSACAGKPLSREEGTAVFIEEVPGISKSEAQRRATSYLAKHLGDSNHAIKINDAANGKLVSRVSVKCNDLKTSFLDPNSHWASYNLDFESKDNRARIALEPVAHQIVIAMNPDTENPPVESEKEAFKKCAGEFKGGLVSAIKSKPADW
jgi:hypothetical protein